MTPNSGAQPSRERSHRPWRRDCNNGRSRTAPFEESPVELLVTAELGRLWLEERRLERALREFRSGPAGDPRWDAFLDALAEIQRQTRRLERLLDAMRDCGCTKRPEADSPLA